VKSGWPDKKKNVPDELKHKHTRQLKDLVPGDIVYMKLPGAYTFTRGKVIGKKGTRSYRGEVEGKSYVRNRRQLLEAVDPLDEEIEERHEIKIPNYVPSPVKITQPVPESRLKRNRNPPERYGHVTN